MATTDTNIFAFSPMPIKLSFRQKKFFVVNEMLEIMKLVSSYQRLFLLTFISNAFKRTLYFKSAFFKKKF